MLFDAAVKVSTYTEFRARRNYLRHNADSFNISLRDLILGDNEITANIIVRRRGFATLAAN